MKNFIIILGLLLSFGAFAQKIDLPENSICTIILVEPCEGSEDFENGIGYFIYACGVYATAEPAWFTNYLCQFGEFPKQILVLDRVDLKSKKLNTSNN